MPLNKSKGNMFDFITHTWNPIKGACFHDCAYCYMKRWKTLKPAHFDISELKTNLGEGNFIFIGSSIDIFADNIENAWLMNTFTKANWYDNKYLLQTKNPFNYHGYFDFIYPKKYILSTTIESNRIMGEMNKSPAPKSRALAMKNLPEEYRRMVTIEPIMYFDLKPMLNLILSFNPEQVNIEADSGNNGLWEPSAKETRRLIEGLEKYTKVILKPNLSRILKGAA
jgi:DNA repair photolyase